MNLEFRGKKCRGIVAYWKIEFNTKSQKQFAKLNKQSQKLLQTYFNYELLRLDHPRLICKLEEEVLIILIVKIAKRDVIYKD